MNTLTVAILLAIAAVGCGGDDATAGGSAGTGGSASAGKSAAGSKATAGAGGETTYSGGECVTKAKTDATGFAEACLSCACEQDAKVVASCDGACWSLMACAATKCGDKTGAEAQGCAQSMCGAEISASLASGSVVAISPLSAILRGEACGASCK